MSAAGIDAFFAAVYAVRWILIVLGFIAMGGLVAGADARAKTAEKNARRWETYAAQLEDEIDDLRAHRRGRRPVVALKPKAGARRG